MTLYALYQGAHTARVAFMEQRLWEEHRDPLTGRKLTEKEWREVNTRECFRRGSKPTAPEIVAEVLEFRRLHPDAEYGTIGTRFGLTANLVGVLCRRAKEKGNE